jgi:TPP-dependent indolepyruvate ferredoxin oxidoreductase alpha subunit
MSFVQQLCACVACRPGECKRHIRPQVLLMYADVVANAACKKSTLSSYIAHVHTSHIESMCFKAPRPFLCSGCPSRGIELLMRVRLRC